MISNRVLRLRHRHAVAGHDDHVLASRSISAVSAALMALTSPRLAGAAPPDARSPAVVPKPPAMTLMKLRFIAAHMM